MLRCEARVRVRADHAEYLRFSLDARAAEEAAAQAAAAEPDDDGWIELTVQGESEHILANDLLRMAAAVEVLEPASLRERMATIATEMAALYDVRPSAPVIASTSRLAIAT